ncbi:DUF2911 domain-containing protein [Pontimicrobium aquaticum]|uniref:DUF2911 domain-containing protein n=1 Tax=Pontimicrobium aquaticum TaxID=2565367 RepID=A0A4U0F3C0_9FLAO|nr:DUF2911 domain-containing protein [Pontimicrobium aquaticum]TJY37232.1 DUF2911 domain-containing protein [Pontimicrobium aquaticum]
MKKLRITLVLLVVATVTFAQQSPRKQATGNIGAVAVEVDYGAPSVRDRVIWGELVPYGKVWRAGANENTTISFDKDVTVGDQKVPAGKYGLFFIPNEGEQWIIVFSKKNDAWGSNGYSKENDLIRLKVNPKKGDKSVEQMAFHVGKKGVQFAWEKVTIFIPIN